MSTDDYLDARWEAEEEARRDALNRAHEDWLTILDANFLTEEDYPFEEFLRESETNKK